MEAVELPDRGRGRGGPDRRASPRYRGDRDQGGKAGNRGRYPGAPVAGRSDGATTSARDVGRIPRGASAAVRLGGRGVAGAGGAPQARRGLRMPQDLRGTHRCEGMWDDVADPSVLVEVLHDDHLEHRLISKTPFRPFGSELLDQVMVQRDRRRPGAPQHLPGTGASDVLAQVAPIELLELGVRVLTFSLPADGLLHRALSPSGAWRDS